MALRRQHPRARYNVSGVFRCTTGRRERKGANLRRAMARGRRVAERGERERADRGPGARTTSRAGTGQCPARDCGLGTRLCPRAHWRPLRAKRPRSARACVACFRTLVENGEERVAAAGQSASHRSTCQRLRSTRAHLGHGLLIGEEALRFFPRSRPRYRLRLPPCAAAAGIGEIAVRGPRHHHHALAYGLDRVLAAVLHQRAPMKAMVAIL